MSTAPDHRAFMAALAPGTRADLTRRMNAPGLRHLALHAGLIAATGALIGAGVPFWPLLLPVQGVLLVFLFTPEHECTHRTPFRNPRLCDAVGQICGVVLLLPFEWFRYFHLAHHRFTNDPHHDPELAGGGRPTTRAAFAWHVSGLPYWGHQSALLLRLALGREHAEYLPQAATQRMQREAWGLLFIYAAVALFTALASPILLWLWIVPVLIGQPVLRLYLLAEHGGCPHVADMFCNTRTTLTTRAVRFLAWNMPYHTEHHVYPNVPFHRLPEFHRLIRARLLQTENGYLRFTAAYLRRLDG